MPGATRVGLGHDDLAGADDRAVYRLSGFWQTRDRHLRTHEIPIVSRPGYLADTVEGTEGIFALRYRKPLHVPRNCQYAWGSG
jgi:hypothetical protein